MFCICTEQLCMDPALGIVEVQPQTLCGKEGGKKITPNLLLAALDLVKKEERGVFAQHHKQLRSG